MRDERERVNGIGGFFFRARDPKKLAAWYDKHLGVDSSHDGTKIWEQEMGMTVFAPFEKDTDYFGSMNQPFMLNFRVDNLDRMLTQLKDEGIDEVRPREELEGIGRFGWVSDPEGNRIELWEPAAQQEEE